MEFVLIPVLGLSYALILTDVLEALFGWILAKTKSLHHVGIRFMSMSWLGCRFVPRYCRSQCDRSCGNWTCPNYHK